MIAKSNIGTDGADELFSCSTTDVTLLDIQDVTKLFGVCPVTASKIMDESGAAIRLHRKKYVRSDKLYTYLQTIEGV